MLTMSVAQCLQTQICRLEYPLLPSYTSTLLYSAFVIVLVIFFYGVYRKFSIYGIGGKEIYHTLPKLLTNGRKLVTVGFGQKKIVQRRFGGWMHSWMFYGIASLTIGTILVGIDFDILRPNGIILLQGDFYLGFKTALDLLGLAFVIAVALAISRRVSFKPFWMGRDPGDMFILAGMLYMGISGFVQEGLRLALIPVPWAYFSPIGTNFASAFTSLGASPAAPNLATWISFYDALWWVHALVAFALIASIPFTKFFHVPDSIINMILYDQDRPLGRMDTPFNLAEITRRQAEDPNFVVPELTIGITTTNDISWDRKAMLDSCTNCGRCEAACPATAAGRDLSPRVVVQDLKNQFYRDHASMHEKKKGEAVDLISAGVIRAEEMYSCVTCAACVYECPVMINQLDFITDLRRTLVSTNKIDPKQTQLLSNLASHQNPYGFSNDTRGEWAKDLGIKTLQENPEAEYLYFVGCVCSFDERARKVAISLSEIMKEAGLSFAILGREEACNGDPARRLGEEGRYQELALQNIEKMNSYKVKKVLTSCPHCFNTIKNEYPIFGGNYEVVHHSQLISDLIKEGKIKANSRKDDSETLTMHDACYAARFNDISSEPREILKASGHCVREMHRSKKKTFCCGAGGSNYWYKVPQRQTITGIRTEEASETGAETIATECPFCLSMFEDAIRVSGKNMKVKDVAEVFLSSKKDT